jgi:hypothetical protein
MDANYAMMHRVCGQFQSIGVMIAITMSLSNFCALVLGVIIFVPLFCIETCVFYIKYIIF